MKILALIVTYNRLDLLKECICALRKQIYKDFDFLVIDNASTDETLQFLQKENISHIHLDKNTGGAGGFSRGFKEAVNKDYDYVWAMDDDTIPEKDCLQKFVQDSSKLNNDFGFLCSYIKWKDNEPCLMNIPTPCLLKSSNDVAFALNGLIRVKSASFVSIFIPIRIIKKYGLPIKEFFIWGDDVEYSQRISKYEKCYCDYKSVALHKMKSNNPTDIISDEPERIGRYKFAFRNRCVIARQDGIKGVIINNLSVFYQVIKILKSKSSKKGKKILVVISSWIRGQFFYPKIEYPKL